MALVVPVKGLDDKKIVQIACGQQHSIALDEDGYARECPVGECELIGFPTQHCVCLGLQWLLPSRPRESEGHLNTPNRSPGKSRYWSSYHELKRSLYTRSLQGHKNNISAQRWRRGLQVLW
jgi:hypothetical protein